MRSRGAAIVHAQSPRYPSIADLTADFVYARLMRSEASRAAGYAPGALDAWAAHAQAWARGGDPPELAHVSAAGDTHVDVQAARHAGVLNIGVCSGKLDADGFAGQPADYVLPSIAQVLDLPEFAGEGDVAQRRAS